MATLKFKTGEKADDPGVAKTDGSFASERFKTEAERMLPLAQKFGSDVLEGSLLAMWVGDSKGENIDMLFANEDGLIRVQVPHGATSIEQFPEEGECYATGLAVILDLADAHFDDPRGKAALVQALYGYDRKMTMGVVRGWVDWLQKQGDAISATAFPPIFAPPAP